MHILFIIGTGDSKYGAAQSLLGLIQNLRQLDSSVQVSIIRPLRSSVADFQIDGCMVYQAPYALVSQGKNNNRLKQPVRYIRRGLPYLYGRLCALRYLEEQMDLNTVDIIHINSSNEDFGGQIAEKYHKPLV